MSGLKWNNPVTISGFNSSDPRIVVDTNGNSTAIWVEQSTYNTGTASQSGLIITGLDTIFTTSMVGGTIIYSNGVTVSITSFVSDTSLTTTTSLIITNQTYKIYYNGIITTKNMLNGGTWSSATQLSIIGNNAITPKIAFDSNLIISIVWTENNVINYATNNGTWSSITTLSGSGCSNPTLSVDNVGNVAVAWVSNSQIQVIIKPISTGLWSLITTFTTTNSNNPSIAIGGGITTIVWYAKPSTQDQIITSTATIVSGVFSIPVNIVGIANTGHMHKFPKVAVDLNGNSLAVWYRSDFGGSTNNDYINVVIISTILLVGAGSWGLPVGLSNLGMRNPTDLTIKCAFDSVGNAYILWTSSTIGSAFNIEANIRQISGILSGAVQIISGNLSAYNTSISVSPLSNVLVVYMYYDGINSTIKATETDIGGYPLNIYSPQVTISKAGTNNSQPRGSISLTGNTVNAIVVLESYDFINKTIIIQAVTGSKQLLKQPTSLTVNQISNNLGVFNRFDNVLNWNISIDPNTIGYNIYRNNIFICQVDYTTVSFIDQNCRQSGMGTNVIYSIASIDSNYQQSRRLNMNIS